MKYIETVHVVFKTHLDIGFTDLSHNVVDKYMHHYIPGAIALAERLAEERGAARFVWTTGSWLIHEYLRQADGNERETMEQAISRGLVTWHGLPFTTHTELLDEGLFKYGLSLSKRLDARFGKQTIAAKMSDVPGHTMAIVPHLVRNGIKFLHLGVNFGSKIPAVPPLFIWRAKDGSELIVNYGSGYGKVLEVEGLRDALVFAHTGDNMGPPSAEVVRNLFVTLGEKYPNAVIKASTLDEFAEKLVTIKHQLPIVEEEIGDSWIHGAASDPWKIERYRELLRLRNRWIQEGRFDGDGLELARFSDNLLLVAEHTWGMDLKRYLPDYRNYTKQSFNVAREENQVAEDVVPVKYKYLANHRSKEPTSYQLFESSWKEQREYLYQAIAALDEDKRNEAIHAFAELEPQITELHGARVLLAGEPYKLGTFEVCFASDGSIVRLEDGYGKKWADECHRLGVFRYETFGVKHYHSWFQQYVSNQYSTNVWADADFGKPGMELCQPSPTGAVYLPRLVSLQWQEEETQDLVIADLQLSDEAVELYGAPAKLRIRYAFSKEKGRMETELVWLGKSACRLPEASWFSFVPKVDNPNLWKMDKMGDKVSPLAVVRNGGRNLHAVFLGVDYFGSDGSVQIETLDAPLVAPGERRLLQFDNTFVSLDGGMHFNLHNNIWGTNFPMWCEDDLKFRFAITMESARILN
ncbi:MAG: glycoside hydrolase [Bacilli bacterium]|nr:glycoside hydrolase [Bacilli bacterium]